MSPHVRRRTVADVKTATLSGRAPSLDQSRLWRDVDSELHSSGVSSSTSNYYEIVERQGREARERASALAPAPGQVGVLVLSGGALVGLEATGHHGLWSELSAPTLASYLMGYSRGHERARRERASAGEWLARVQSARLAETPGLGLGHDLDLQAPGLSGVGLAMRRRARPRRGFSGVIGNGPAVAVTWVTLVTVKNDPGLDRRSLAPSGPATVEPWIRARERDDGDDRPR